MCGAMRPRSFNCAAPFRERLDANQQVEQPAKAGLQLCRPLSGAVSRAGRAAGDRRRSGFNCAAPFRERLVH